MNGTHSLSSDDPRGGGGGGWKGPKKREMFGLSFPLLLLLLLPHTIQGESDAAFQFPPLKDQPDDDAWMKLLSRGSRKTEEGGKSR